MCVCGGGGGGVEGAFSSSWIIFFSRFSRIRIFSLFFFTFFGLASNRGGHVDLLC